MAPLWKFVPLTVTGTVAPCSPPVGDTPASVGTTGTTAVAVATVSSVNVTVRVSVVPATNFALK